MDFIRRHKNPFIVLLVLILASATYAADTLLRNLTAAASAGNDDALYLVYDPNGVPANRKIGFQELMASITRVGTIATGVWQGTDVGVSYGGTGASTLNDLITLTTHTTGNYAAGDAEAGAALTGDSATAFFSAGTIEHEYGGLEANVSAYSGLVAIAAGAAAEVDALSELVAQLADVTKIFTDDDIVGPSADPDINASGELGIDTDGANEPNDVILRTADTGGDTQYALAQVLKTIQATIVKPQDLADATRDLCVIWHNSTGMTFTITEIMAWSDTDDTTVTVELVTATDFSAPATVDVLEIATNGTSVFTCTETTITDATVAHDEILTLDFDDTDDPGWVKITISGYFNADVN